MTRTFIQILGMKVKHMQYLTFESLAQAVTNLSL